jgi:hypothetical protein
MFITMATMNDSKSYISRELVLCADHACDAEVNALIARDENVRVEECRFEPAEEDEDDFHGGSYNIKVVSDSAVHLDEYMIMLTENLPARISDLFWV